MLIKIKVFMSNCKKKRIIRRKELFIGQRTEKIEYTTCAFEANINIQIKNNELRRGQRLGSSGRRCFPTKTILSVRNPFSPAAEGGFTQWSLIMRPAIMSVVCSQLLDDPVVVESSGEMQCRACVSADERSTEPLVERARDHRTSKHCASVARVYK